MDEDVWSHSGSGEPELRALPAAWAGRVLGQRYVLQRMVGQGASATVFEAEHLGLERTVAVKLLPHHGTSTQTRRRLAREAKILSTIEHPSVVRVLDYGQAEDDRADYLVMEFLRGRTLKEAELSPIVRTWPWIRAAVGQLLDALATVHARGVIHRDIKPSNCFCVDFDETAPTPTMKLLDFGVSTSEQCSALTASGAVLGTVLYMAPEQARGMATDVRADLYAVGVILYELVTGVLPFAGSGFLDVMWRQVYSDPTPPQEANPRIRIPPELEALIVRALQKNPDRRFQTAEEFASAVRDIDGEDIVCAEPPPLTKIGPNPATPAEHRNADGSSARFTLGDTETSLPETIDSVRILDNAAKTWLTPIQPIPGFESLVLRQRRTLEPTDVDSFWPHGVAGVENAPRAHLPALASIPALFDDVDRSLLLLGGPGSGKTHGLLQIAADLHARASCAPERAGPLPVLFDISGWSPSRRSLKEWLLTQLQREHRVPRSSARKWLHRQRLVPLLDGLDRMPKHRQEAAVAGINAFLIDVRPPGLAVACRSHTYRALAKRLQLRAAVELHELDVEELRHGLRATHPQWAPFAQAIEDNPQLAGFVSTPLGFRVVASVAREDDGIKRLQSTNIREMGAIYDVYTELLLRRRREAVDIDVLLQTVAELAADLTRFGVTWYRAEVLQPGWIGHAPRRLVYLFGTRLLIAVLIGASCILAVGKTPLDNGGLVTNLAFGARYGLAVALGLSFGHVLDALVFHSQESPLRVKSPRLRWLVSTALSTLVGAALLSSWTTLAPIMALIACGLGSAVFVAGQGGSFELEDITLTDELQWSWAQVRARLPWIGGAGATMLLFTGLAESPMQGVVNGALAVGLGIGLGGTRRVTASAEPETGQRDDAMHRMARRSWVGGAIAFVATTLLFTPAHGVVYAMCAALPVAVVIALWFGGLAGIYHLVLRALLRVERSYVRDRRLLDTAARIGLLDQRPNGYRFFHQSYAEYFSAKVREPAHASVRSRPLLFASRLLSFSHSRRSR